jgi:hypothetical protein
LLLFCAPPLRRYFHLVPAPGSRSFAWWRKRGQGWGARAGRGACGGGEGEATRRLKKTKGSPTFARSGWGSLPAHASPIQPAKCDAHACAPRSCGKARRRKRPRAAAGGRMRPPPLARYPLPPPPPPHSVALPPCSLARHSSLSCVPQLTGHAHPRTHPLARSPVPWPDLEGEAASSGDGEAPGASASRAVLRPRPSLPPVSRFKVRLTTPDTFSSE